MRIWPFAFSTLFLSGSAVAGPFAGIWRIDETQTRRDRPPFERLLADGRYRCPDCLPIVDAPADGRIHPASGPHADRVRVRVKDARTVQTEFWRAGQLAYDNQLVVSADGQRMTNLRIQHFSKPPVKVRLDYERATAAPAGTHAISGGWTLLSSNTSENGLRTWIDDAGGSLRVRGSFGQHNAVRPNERFDARVNGPPALVVGNPDRPKVTVARSSSTVFDLNWSKGGKLVAVQRLELGPDGRTMTSSYRRLSDNSTVVRTLRKLD